MKLKILMYATFFLLLAASCNETVIDPETLTPSTTELKDAVIGTNYYVSTTGSNSNSGLTEALAFATIQYAAGYTKPGDNVIVLDGTYTSGSNGTFGYITRPGTASAYITFKAKNKGRAIINGQNNLSSYGFHIVTSYINIEGFEIKGVNTMGIALVGASYVNIKDNNIHDIGRLCTETYIGLDAIYSATSSHITIERNLIHDIGRFGPGESGCTPTSDYWKGHDHGCYINGSNYLSIQNNVFYNMNRGFSMQVYSGENRTSSYINFINNTCENGNFYNTVQGHVVLYGSINNGVIANNIFKDQYSSAIHVAKVSYTYTNVLITKNMTAGGNGATTYGTAAGVTITGNYDGTDPLFVDEANHNYALKSSSPAISLGYNTGLTTDYLNSTRSTINIGAYSSASVSSSTTVVPSSTTVVPSSTTVVPSSTVFYNVQMSATATKNDCGTGYTGSTVTYTVPAGYYSSKVSQDDANNIAIARLADNKQYYANAKGTCTILSSTSKVYYNVQMSATATKNDCGTGYVGSIVKYTVPAGYYTSKVSQTDANNIAIARLADNKQYYANAKGTCTLIR